MTETVNLIRGEDTDFGVVYVPAIDYARLEQECERLRSLWETELNRAATAESECTAKQWQLDAALRQVEALILAGNPMSNAAYNLAQKTGQALTKYDCELLSIMRKNWAAALSTPSPQ